MCNVYSDKGRVACKILGMGGAVEVVATHDSGFDVVLFGSGDG